ncbi:hypothetical protein M2459_002389 [Parabacteroides sp. PF5-5]|uniref:hypothetical protein n=1 Tax=unclassified Parabacteroides TaxID=2649774 RepID=UPI0024731742|nr:MULTISPECIES: hypothetical protein [unclassified Parabacteroides]MDH6305289.1 hypothetical protein [Parabacteroides sp. PH5-39]MDH6316642.1 hypothetical protein [Parabacteroides sp. PF5-13]MDH6320178.1 hypothetical protein [Parabacteroides sp. PH5-13]MDH6323879.1 hypothetical protein [Parabacteroides sp. PH5-8]MDH6327855.1 hypothetical protein [Parabacteroides sp. PH5-41]
MKEKDDVFGRFRESFSKMDGHFHILEQRVPVDLQMEYFKYSEKIRQDQPNNMTEEEYESYKQSLSDKEIATDQKKYALSSLAVSNEVRAYRVLEQYVQHPDPDVMNWAYMALMESRISLESELSEEKQIYISTGLGGKGEKLRFYVLILATENTPFQDYQRQVIEREFAYYLPKENCEIERLTIHDVYVELLFLIPVRVDIQSALNNVISECNQYGNFLSMAFTVTNVKELSETEIAEIIKKKYGDDQATL